MKKIIGIIILALLIATTLPAYGLLNYSESDIKIKTTLNPGENLRFLFFDWSLRSYRFYLPQSYNGENSMPLVFVLHGYPANSNDIMSYTELNEKADDEGFIAVYPNGGTDLSTFFYYFINYGYWGFWGFYWNCWDYYDCDDVGFIRKLIDNFQSEFNIDENRIYVTGWSNGGMMSYRLGAELSDIIAAIGPVGGSIGGVWNYWEDEYSLLSQYIIPEPENSLPVIVFHGMNDSSVPYDGVKNPETEDILLYSVNESVGFWVEHNNCDPNPQINISDSGNIISRTYTNDNRDFDVVLYTVVDGEHEWFGSSYSPCEISINDIMWEFFENHPKK